MEFVLGRRCCHRFDGRCQRSLRHFCRNRFEPAVLTFDDIRVARNNSYKYQHHTTKLDLKITNQTQQHVVTKHFDVPLMRRQLKAADSSTILWLNKIKERQKQRPRVPTSGCEMGKLVIIWLSFVTALFRLVTSHLELETKVCWVVEGTK